jgi:hypothetical protein
MAARHARRRFDGVAVEARKPTPRSTSHRPHRSRVADPLAPPENPNPPPAGYRRRYRDNEVQVRGFSDTLNVTSVRYVREFAWNNGDWLIANCS